MKLLNKQFSFRKMTTSQTNNPHGFVKSENESHQVVVWSKTYCPYCKETKKLLKSMKGVEMVVHEIDNEKDGYRLQQELYRLTGQRSVPNVFVNNKHIGGNDDTQSAYKNGTLQDLLSA